MKHLLVLSLLVFSSKGSAAHILIDGKGVKLGHTTSIAPQMDMDMIEMKRDVYYGMNTLNDETLSLPAWTLSFSFRKQSNLENFFNYICTKELTFVQIKKDDMYVHLTLPEEDIRWPSVIRYLHNEITLPMELRHRAKVIVGNDVLPGIFVPKFMYDAVKLTKGVAASDLTLMFLFEDPSRKSKFYTQVTGLHENGIAFTNGENSVHITLSKDDTRWKFILDSLDEDASIPKIIRNEILFPSYSLNTSPSRLSVSKRITGPEMDEKISTVSELQKAGPSSELEQIKKSTLEKTATRIAKLSTLDASKPVKSISVRGQTFLVSKIITMKARRYAVLYTEGFDDGLIAASLLYTSKSDGGWRVSPFVSFDNSLSKGQGIHYTQETKPIPEIIHLMETLEDTNAPMSESLYSFFRLNLLEEELARKEFSQAVRPSKLSIPTSDALKIIRSFKPGFFFGGQSLSGTESVRKSEEEMRRVPAKINAALKNPILAQFVPDFKNQKPNEVYTFKHTLLGATVVKVYSGILGDRMVHWHMASDSANRIWIDRIRFPDSPVSIYGVDSEFLDSGALTEKPLEYNTLCWKLENIVYEDGSCGQTGFPGHYEYSDITGFLSQLLPIQLYRASQR